MDPIQQLREDMDFARQLGQLTERTKPIWKGAHKFSFVKLMLLLILAIHLAALVQFSQSSQELKKKGQNNAERAKKQAAQAKQLKKEAAEKTKEAQEHQSQAKADQAAAQKEKQAARKERQASDKFQSMAKAAEERAKQAADAASKERKKQKRLDRDAQQSDERAKFLQKSAAVAVAAGAAMEGKASADAVAAARYKREAARDEAETEADVEETAMVEWIPLCDVVADVVGGGAALALQADATRSEALGVRKVRKAASERAKALRLKAEAAQLKKRMEQATEETAKMMSRRSLVAGAATAAVKLSDRDASQAHRDHLHSEHAQQDAVKYEKQSQKLTQQKDRLESQSEREVDTASDSLSRAHDDEQKAKSLKNRERSELQQAATYGARATMLLLSASITSSLQMLSLWPISFVPEELSQVVAPQINIVPLLGECPMQAQLWPRWVKLLLKGLETLSAAASLLALICVSSWGEGVVLAGISAIGGWMFFCTCVWRRTELRNCLSGKHTVAHACGKTLSDVTQYVAMIILSIWAYGSILHGTEFLKHLPLHQIISVLHFQDTWIWAGTAAMLAAGLRCFLGFRFPTCACQHNSGEDGSSSNFCCGVPVHWLPQVPMLDAQWYWPRLALLVLVVMIYIWKGCSVVNLYRQVGGRPCKLNASRDDLLFSVCIMADVWLSAVILRHTSVKDLLYVARQGCNMCAYCRG